MKRPTIEAIHEAMKRQGMTVFSRPYSITLGGIRSNDNRSGKFNDWIFMSFFTERGGLVSLVVEGTTDAGLYYRENPINVDGTAIIKHGKQFKGVYQYQNPKLNPSQIGHKGQEAFKQIGDMEYWRDADRDLYLNFCGDTKIGNYATNGHDMGKIGEDVGKWSAGCWGATEGNMEILYRMAQIQIKAGQGDKFSFAMLHENHF